MALKVDFISKRYGGTVALHDVSTEFLPGDIHAVLGENGAGKSTLMAVIAGFVKPDIGRITLEGEPLPLGRAFEAKCRGIGMIHQHFTLVPALTVKENLTLARLPGLFQPLRADDLVRSALEAAKRLGWDLNPDQRVEELSVGQRQRLEILKALGNDAQILILDEPTAVLTRVEVLELFATLRTLRSEGKTVILIAHKLSEVVAIADRVTVLRKGEKVATRPMAKTNATQLARWMVGDESYQSETLIDRESEPGDTALEVRSVRIKGDQGQEAVRGIDLDFRRREIVAIGGVDGNGQAELAEAIARVRPLAAGTITELRVGLKTGYIPQDRQNDGLAIGMSIADNLLATGHHRKDLATHGWLHPDRIFQWAGSLMARFDIRATSPKVRTGGLSGGNQQKVVVARALAENPSVLVAVNPTRGLDLKAAAFVHSQIRAARDNGTAVALFSTDLDELRLLGDRIVFLSRGELTETLV
ncbi:ABC transporter ATP-binding protein [soil metagenome]